MENEPPVASTNSQNPTHANIMPLIIVGWILTSVIMGFVGYAIGTSSLTTKTAAENKQQVLTEANPSPSDDSSHSVATVLSAAATMMPTTSPNILCSKNGFAKPQEYLKPYVLKANDSAQSVAEDQLHDATRVNEILRINGQGPFPIGYTLYLPPENVANSSGNLRQVYGKLVERDDTSWHISFTTDKSGQGVLIPSYLFLKVPNKDSINIGDCVKVFFDDGYTVYSVDLQ